MRSYEYSDDYPTCLETYSTLRVYSDDLQPGEITEILGLQPHRSFAKGDAFGTSDRRRKATGWFYSTKNLVRSRDTRRHIDEVLAALEGKRDATKALIERGCKLDIMSYWLSIGQGGPAVESEQMQRLADLQIGVWWDVYFASSDEIES